VSAPFQNWVQIWGGHEANALQSKKSNAHHPHNQRSYPCTRDGIVLLDFIGTRILVACVWIE
jgi:hypothetical protein